MPITTSASTGERVGRGRPGRADRAERTAGGRSGSEPLPAWVSPTGMPVASHERPQRVVRLGVVHAAAGDDQRAPAERISVGRSVEDTASGSGRATCQTRARRTARPASRTPRPARPAGSARVTAPVSTGSVSTRIALSSADGSCSGRLTRSKNRDTGRNASLTRDVAGVRAARAPAAPGSRPGWRRCPTGSSSTGSRLIVASAAPVSMFVEPGPTRRGAGAGLQPVRAAARTPTAVCTMACSLRART